MSRHRDGELGFVPLRSGRFYYVDNKWYFTCREGRDQGPFDSKPDAELALTRYINSVSHFPGQDNQNPTQDPPVPYP